MTSHEAVYNYPPPLMVSFEPEMTQDADIERKLESRDDLLHTLREAIKMAQNMMQQQHNEGRKTMNLRLERGSGLKGPIAAKRPF